LGWFPVANSIIQMRASCDFTATHNSQGFRDREHRASPTPKILFLGDSFVWGYDVQDSERFTDRLKANHPEWDVWNCGVGGYGTDQEFLLLSRCFDLTKPQVVFLLFCTETDHFDNSSNVRYGGYYKPYYTLAGNQLELHGVPVPRSERFWLSEHRKLARS